MKKLDRSIQLAALIVGSTAGIYARTTLGPLQESVHNALSLSDNHMALLQGPALAVPMVLAAVPLGFAIDRFSRVRLLLFFALLNVAGTLLTAVASSFTVLLMARSLIGLAGTATFITSISVLSDLYAPAQRGRATMALTVGAVVGMSGAFALGGFLLAKFASTPDGWRWAMAWLAAPLVPVVMLLVALSEPVRTGIAVARPAPRNAYAELWSLRRLVAPLLAGLVMVEVATGAALIWAAPTLARRFALPPDRVGSIMATVLLVSGILGPIVGGALADYGQRTGGPRRTMIVLTAMAILSIPAAFFPLAPAAMSLSVLLAGFLIIGLAFNVTVPALTTIVVPGELRGRCLALMSAASMLCAFGIAPLTVSALSGVAGGPQSLSTCLAGVCIVASLFAAVTLMLGSRNFPTTPRDP